MYVCVCVCVCIYIYIYIYIERERERERERENVVHASNFNTQEAEDRRHEFETNLDYTVSSRPAQTS
jgi:hypothetical protein